MRKFFAMILFLSTILMGCASQPTEKPLEEIEKQPTKVESSQVEAQPEEKKETPPIRIIFAGDTMFDWDLRPILNSKGYDYPFTHVKDKVTAADYAVVNFESSITTRTEKWNGQRFWIKSDPESLDAIKNAGFDMVSLANNHVLDYGQAGFEDTLSNLEKANIPYIGAGRNEKEAYSSKEVIIHDKKIRFMAVSRFIPSGEWFAKDEKGGVAQAYEFDRVLQAIEEEKKNSDALIMYIHWGVEKSNQPVEYQKEYMKAMIDAGADAIIGSHPHWLQGFEYYKGKPVAYSLGNFLFPPYVKGHSAETGLLTLTLDKEEIKMNFDPFIISNGLIRPTEGQERQNLLNYLDDLSPNVDVSDNGDIIQK